MAVEHHLVGEERFVVLDAGIVDPRNVSGGEHAHDAGHVERRGHVQSRDPGMRLSHLDRVGMQHVLRPLDEVVGVERFAGDVERRALMWDGSPDDGIARSLRERAHAPTSMGWFVAYTLSRAVRSIALLYAALAR